jgi:flagellar M-ring protein FliF
MVNFFYSHMRQLETIFKALSLPKKIVLSVLLSLVVSLLFLTLLYLRKTDYETLYSHLSPEDAAAIVDKLKAGRVPYKLAADGTAILIPSDKKYDLRLELAKEGLPQGGGVGFEIFDRTNWGLSSFMEKLNFQRALQGELARTISTLAEVEYARVHIVLPEKTIFKEDQKKATASIVIKLRSGMKLSDEKVKGIVHLVASSVEGLEPDEVTVLDHLGRMLTRDKGISTTQQLNDVQLKIQQTLERNIEHRIQTMLEQVLGRDKAIVRVAAELDFQQIESTEEGYDPDKVVVRSEQRVEEKSIGQGIIPLGVPGVSSNIPSPEQPKTAGEKKQQENLPQSQRTTETINYELSKIVRHIISPYTQVRRLSAAVLIDGTYKKKDDGTYEYIPRSAEELSKLESIIKGAMGYDSNRGDQLQVVNVAFNTSPIAIDAEMKAGFALGDWLVLIAPLIKKILTLIIPLIMFFLFILKPILNWLSETSQELTIPTDLPKRLDELKSSGQLTEPEASGELDLREKVLEFAKSDPGRTAQLAKEWLREEM